MKSISILGSTGSIGTQALEVIKNNPHLYKVKALACHSDIHLLKEQIDTFNPDFVAVYDKKKADELNGDVTVYKGMKGILKASTCNATILNSLVGSIGVLPTLKAIKAKNNIALANKETLVTAGSIIMKEVKKQKVKLKPIDSEHSAILQSLRGSKQSQIKKLIITCSGGPFRNYSLAGLKKVTKKQALNHPNWAMGAKITIDSSTLMNKALEIIEAHHLFNMDYDNIDVVIHPESIIHSLVEFKDTSVIAQLGWPDMKIPIQYALTHPERIKNNLKSLDLSKVSKLHFSKPDFGRFPCLRFGYDAGKKAGTLPCVLNAANEIAVEAFLRNKIDYIEIPKIIKRQLLKHNTINNPDIAEILDLDEKVKNKLSKELLK